jgi:hypothetical protein
MKPEPGDLYRHYKGTIYKIITVANLVTDDRTNPPEMIVYQDTSAPEKIWVRDFTVWNGDIEVDGKTIKRFTAL